MSNRETNRARGYYFALPRLWALLTGGETSRQENNWIEAYFVGLAVFLISYAALVAQLRARVLLAAALLLAVWLGWLAVLFLNARIVDVLRRAGWLSAITNSRAQNLLIGIEATLCAVALTRQPLWWLVGWSWLLVVAANCAAAVILRVANNRDA